MSGIDERLEKILPVLLGREFERGARRGSELPFYVFDYDPEDELKVREHVTYLEKQVPIRKPGFRVKAVNLLVFLVEVLKSPEEDLLEHVFEMQKRQGDEAVLKALNGVLNEITAPLLRLIDPMNCDCVLLHGVGSVYPLLRSHSILSRLEHKLVDLPVVLFYPGRYNGHTMDLFNRISPEGHYRAHRLVP